MGNREEPISLSLDRRKQRPREAGRRMRRARVANCLLVPKGFDLGTLNYKRSGLSGTGPAPGNLPPSTSYRFSRKEKRVITSDEEYQTTGS
jgi:hypothetical protein